MPRIPGWLRFYVVCTTQMFVPMPAAQLTHPLFESEGRDRHLQLQNFHPVSCRPPSP